MTIAPRPIPFKRLFGIFRRIFYLCGVPATGQTISSNTLSTQATAPARSPSDKSNPLALPMTWVMAPTAPARSIAGSAHSSITSRTRAREETRRKDEEPP